MFKEAAIELRNITHSYESDLSINALLSKKPIVGGPEFDQTRINVFRNQNGNYNQNETILNANLNGIAPNGHLNKSNGGLNGGANNANNHIGYNLNNHSNRTYGGKEENVQMIRLNQSKNFPSFYFAQNDFMNNENNNYQDYNRNETHKRSRALSQDSFSKKSYSEPVPTKRYVLNQLDMTVPKGTIYGLLGPSGCGKTTLLKIMTGLIKPDRGTVSVFNCDPRSGDGNIPGHDIGYMPQDYSLHDDLTIGEMLYYFGRIYKMDTELIKIKIKELVEKLELPDEHQVVSSLSGGQKRRASFCCAIVHMPRLLILDEPTVGCDPVLRERIWGLLDDFSKNNKITVIITTHYIEEAKRSSMVGFMKKGCLIAENTPENLFKNYETRSLENIFYQLCLSDKRTRNRGAMSSKPTSPTSEKPPPITSLSREQDKAKNYYFYNRQLPPSSNVPPKKTLSETFRTFCIHLKALCLKQIIYSFRKPETTVAQFIVPLIVIMFFCVCVGSLPRGIAVGIFNEENCNHTDICLSEDLITYLNSYSLTKYPYNNLTKALQDAKSKKLFGVLRLGPNFTEAFIDKLHFDNSSTIINQSVITFNGDMTNSVLMAIFENIFYNDYFDFVRYALHKLEIKPSYGKLPVTIGEEVFGKYVKKDYSAINAYAAPGLLIIIVYSVSFALTGLSLLTEKTNGVFERNIVSGVTTNTIVISHLIINMSVFAFGLFFLLQMTTKLYDIPFRGSFIAGYSILLLQCFTGLGNGLLLSAVMDTIWAYAITGNGILLFIFITSGALWPLESMPFYINWLAYFLPSTLAIESLRSILVRGISITKPIVYHGFLMSIAWAVGMIAIAGFIFKRQNGASLLSFKF